MNCIFCNILTTNTTPAYFQDNHYSECFKCNIVYYHNSHANMRMKNSNFKAPYIQFDLIPLIPRTRLIIGADVIVRWDYMPNINPTNLNNKLKTYLVFS